jgi:hypothetical protein
MATALWGEHPFAPLLGTDKKPQGSTSRIGKTEGTLRGRSATLQQLDSAQTSYGKNARRPARKAAWTHKAAVKSLSQLANDPARMFKCRIEESMIFQSVIDDELGKRRSII